MVSLVCVAVLQRWRLVVAELNGLGGVGSPLELVPAVGLELVEAGFVVPKRMFL